MITYVRSSLFESPAQTLVNTVNVVGVMGKGIALEFKNRFPAMFKAYKGLCESQEIDVGKLHLWRGEGCWILNFPTKTTWKKPSKIEYIEAGLDVFVKSYKQMSIDSISFPPLGCGNGNLNWSDVKPIMERYLSCVDIPVYIHDFQVPIDYVPEHSEFKNERIPVSFEDFQSDIRDHINSRSKEFRTLSGSSTFSADWHVDGSIIIKRSGRSEQIPIDLVEWAWRSLQGGMLTAEDFTGEWKKTKSYFLPIIAKLPYVRLAQISKPGWSVNSPSYGLYISRDAKNKGAIRERVSDVGVQGCLSL